MGKCRLKEKRQIVADIVVPCYTLVILIKSADDGVGFLFVFFYFATLANAFVAYSF